jgi:hypothetical protein
MNKYEYNIDYIKLYKQADLLADIYKNNKPFPSIYLDNFLSAKDYRKISAAFPKANDPIWKTPSNKHTVGKSVTRNGDLGLKEYLFNENARRFFYELNSGLFLNFLEKLTGISGLICDPYFSEGGFHKTGQGGFLNIHADFSHSDRLNLERRVNLIFYLNDIDEGGEIIFKLRQHGVVIVTLFVSTVGDSFSTISVFLRRPRFFLIDSSILFSIVRK